MHESLETNGIIKFVACKHIGKSSIIVAEFLTLRDDILAAKNKGFLDLEIEGDSKIVINCYNKKKNTPSSFKLLIKDIWNLS